MNIASRVALAMRGERDGERKRGRKQRGKRKYEERSQGLREREETRLEQRDCNAECLDFIGKRNWEKRNKVQKLKRVGGRGKKIWA